MITNPLMWFFLLKVIKNCTYLETKKHAKICILINNVRFVFTIIEYIFKNFCL